jgi:hypothetical protein
MLAASSGVARGMTPGSVKLVRNNVAITKKNNTLSTTGMAGDKLTARYGQLKRNKHKQNTVLE